MQTIARPTNKAVTKKIINVQEVFIMAKQKNFKTIFPAISVPLNPDVSLITCHDETLCVSWFPGMDGALIGFAGCVPGLICKAWDVFKDPAHHTLKEAQDASNAIYPISQAIYGGGQPSGEAHARLKEALVQRGVFTSGLMRKPVQPLDQVQKDWVSKGLKESGLPKVDMKPFYEK